MIPRPIICIEPMNRTATITLAQPRGAVWWAKASRKTQAGQQGRQAAVPTPA